MDLSSDIPTPAINPIAQGLYLHHSADIDGALQCYAQALELDPSNVQAHYLCALIAVQRGAFEQAHEHLRTACALQPGNAQAALLRGHVLNRLDQPEDALASLDVAQALMPGNTMAWNYRAQALILLQRHDEALAASEQALACAPGMADALFSRGACLHMMGRTAESIASFEELLAASPGHACGHALLARVLLTFRGPGRPELDTLGRALAHLDRAIALQPGMADAHEARGIILECLGNPEDALASYRRALQCNPDLGDAPFGVATTLLSLGDWHNGWRYFEKRWFAPGLQALWRDTGAPPWRGEPLAGKSIALIAEQGLGDMIQFFRFVEPVRALAACVSVVAPPALQRLLAPHDGHASAPTGPFDYYCTFMSLPALLGTLPDTVPGTQGYLRADPALAAAWQQRLAPTQRLRVGLAWSGDPSHSNDHNRSLALAQLAGLFDEDGIDFVCLQKVLRDADRQAHATLPQLAFFGAELHDFADTAALCGAMDLVIAVDTSVAHLAGALGKPVWILLPDPAEWRWMHGREDTPWYSRARLFRQTRRGDWTDVVARVRSELKLLLAKAA